MKSKSNQINIIYFCNLMSGGFCFELGDSLTIAVLENFLLAIEFFDRHHCMMK